MMEYELRALPAASVRKGEALVISGPDGEVKGEAASRATVAGTERAGRVRGAVFLVGCLRSGTTLVRLMLDHHPQIAFHEEFEYAVDRISEVGDWPPLEEYHEALSVHRVFLSSGFKIDKSLSYPGLVNSFLLQKRQRDGKPIVGATVHYDFDRLLLVWPDAKFIHIVRDGRDVARSVMQFGWAGNMWTAADRWVAAERTWERMMAALPPERRIEVKHETLVREPEATLKRICQFLGVAYDQAMFDYTKASTYDLPDPKLLEQWKKKLSEYEVRLVEDRIRDMLVERGYELSGLPPLEVTAKMQRRLRRQDWLARVRFRIKRYGVGLFVADFLSRHLGLRSWQRRVRLRMNDIETANLK
jgi:hypothetical protein